MGLLFSPHLASFSRYGPVIAVNLINTKGYEKPLSDSFANYAAKVTDMAYIHFDFHRECKHGHQALQNLINRLEEPLTNQGFFVSSLKGTEKLQTSMIRTNCIDCLDRTNVVQSLFARHILNDMMTALKLTLPKDFDKHFRNIWADNADAVSIQYSGTPALKTDYTRTGKRTVMGRVNDGMNSLKRYVKNNFWDGERQDGFDLFLGVYAYTPGQPLSKLRQRAVMPLLPLFTTMMLMLVILFEMDTTSRKFSFVLFWLFATMFAVRYLIKNGRSYVDTPKLRELAHQQPIANYEEVGHVRSSWRDARKRPSFGVDIFGKKKDS